MTDFLDEKRSEITARLKELKPLVDEYIRLRAAADALDGVPSTPAQTPRRSARHTDKETPQRRGDYDTKRRGRLKGSGTRGAEALTLVKENPGITIPEIAEKMGIKQNYLYRVLPSLAQEGLVTKDGRGWKPNDGATDAGPEPTAQ